MTTCAPRPRGRFLLSVGFCVALASMFAAAGGAGRAAQDAAALEPQDPRISVVEQAECLAFGDARTARHSRTGRIRSITTVAGRPIPHPRPWDAQGSPEEAARAYLSVCGSLFGLEAPAAQLALRDQSSQILAENGRVRGRRSFVRFQQAHRGVPIVGGELIVHLDEGNNVLFVGGKALSTIRINTTPAIDAAAAMNAALDVVAKAHAVDRGQLTTTTPALWVFDPTLIGPDKGPTRLVWRMEVTPRALLPIRELVLIDAQQGGVALHFNQVDRLLNRQTYTAGNVFTLPGTLVCSEANPSCAGGDIDAVSAHLYSGDAHSFYLNTLGRDSINNAGQTITSTVHYGPANYENAFWNGVQLAYGNGFSRGDDVVGHELTHGVTQYTSGLFYYYQSGAINESLSDVFGELIDQTNGRGNDSPGVRWLMGEDLPVGASRNMANPGLFGDPDRVTSPNYYLGAGDNGGVHQNSGVNNKAASLMVDGGAFNGQTIAGLGATKVAKIYYEVQTHLLTSGADYGDLYDALYQGCNNLIGTAGITATDCQQVRNATIAVEMNLQPAAGFNPDAALCAPGLVPSPSNLFFDNLEGPSGNWTFGALAGTSRWGATSGFAHSGTRSLYASDYPDAVSDSYAAMVSGVPLPANAFLHFAHAFEFDTDAGGYWDGGVVEYSTNGGGTWADAAPLIDTHGYRGTLVAGSGNPLGGRPAFVGASHGYISSRLNLQSLVGQTVRFRWRMGLDPIFAFLGWLVDDVRLYTCVTPTVTADSVSPSAGSGATQTFSLQYSDSVGAADLATAWVWINASFAPSSANSCLLNYTRATNTLSLLNDAGNAYLTGSPGSGATLQNSQCAIALASATAVPSGNTLTLNLPMTFKPTFAGAKTIFMYAANSTGASSGWQTRGAWTVPADSRITPTLTWAAPAGITYGTPLSATQLNATANVPGAFAYTPPAGTVLNGGAGQTLSVTFTPTDTTTYTTATATVPITVARATVGIIWPTPANIIVGTALSATQLNATANVPGTLNVPGTFAYAPPAGTVLAVGAGQTLSVTFTPTAIANYTTATATVAITVIPVPVTTVTADSVTPNSGTGASQTLAFQYSDTAGATDLSTAWVWINASFAASSANSCLLNYTRATNTLSLLNDAGNAYLTGSPGTAATLQNSQCALALASSAALPSGNTLTLTLSMTFAPSFAGAKTIFMYAANSTGASSGWQTRGAWTVPADSRITPTLTWAAPAGITYGTPLSATQLNATANVPGAFAYTPPAGTVLNGGAGQTLSVTFTPTDTTTYTTATATVPITVGRATVRIIWPTPANIIVGTALSATQLNATANVPGTLNVPGTFAYAPPAGTVLAVGAGQTLSVTFTPTAIANYTTATATVAITVIPVPVTTVTADSVTPNSGTGASQTLAFQYSDTAGATDLSTAWVWINASFAASSANSCLLNYTRATNTLSLLNDAGNAYLTGSPGTAATLQNSRCGIALGSSTAVPSGNTLTLTLSMTFAPSFAGAKTIFMYAANSTGASSGWQTRGAWTVPADSRITPTLTWAAPAGITYGTPLSATQLNATANVPGAFAYTPPAGTVLNGGAGQTLSVTFTPTDTTTYTTATATVPITVGRATVGIIWPTPANIIVGTALSATQLNATANVPGTLNVPGTFAYAPPAGTVLAVGAGQTLSVTFTPTAIANYTTATATVAITVIPVPVTTVTADSVTPNSGTGASQTLAFQYSDTAGATDLSTAWVWINASFAASSANSCLLNYTRATNTLSLLNDAGNAYLTGSPGTAATLQNSRCGIALGSSTAVPSGNTLTLTLPMTFAPVFAGAKTIFMYAANAAGTNSGWQTRGVWTVPSGSAPVTVTADSVTPSSGSGSSQVFALQYSDTAGAADLSMAWVWINASFAPSAANSCLFHYTRAANTVSLLNDAGTAYTTGTLGTITTVLTNSQCAIALGSTTASLSGDNLTLHVPITFAAPFAGAKTIFMYGANTAGINSGWQSRGSWTIP